MHGMILACALLLTGQVAVSEDPVALSRELGSSRFAHREAAELALTRLGWAAVPALRDAVGSEDPEVRLRAAAILRKVEGAALVEATAIHLDFDDVPLATAIDAIDRQSGLKLTLVPGAATFGRDRRITVRSAKRLPFWKALDLLCEAGRVHYVFGGQGDFEHGDAAFGLYDGVAESHGLFDDQGPFRVQLASLQYQSEVHLAVADRGSSRQPGRDARSTAPARVESVPLKQFYLQMLVGAEPRLAIAPGGPVRVSEAIDDQGQSLLQAPQAELIRHESGYLGVNPSPLVHLRVDLAHPDRPSAHLKRVKGLIPLVVSMRKADPLAITLADAVHRTFRQDDAELTVGEVRIGQPDQVTTIELTLKPGPKSIGDDGEGQDSVIHAIASPQQLEVVDAAGRMLPWFPSSSFFDGESVRLTLTLLDRGVAPAVPAVLRYHGVIRERTEVPFEFRDLPMP